MLYVLFLSLLNRDGHRFCKQTKFLRTNKILREGRYFENSERWKKELDCSETRKKLKN